ncbi:unnamed protein product [Prunus brigantina]
MPSTSPSSFIVLVAFITSFCSLSLQQCPRLRIPAYVIVSCPRLRASSLMAQVLSNQPINRSVSNSSSVKCKSYVKASIDSEVLTYGVDVVAPKGLCSGIHAVLPMETGILESPRDLP